jgi:hypothetical protein
MNSKNIQKIASKLMEIANHAITPQEGRLRGLWIDVQAGVSYSLSTEYQEKFNDLVRLFLKNSDWSDKFSENFISKKIRTIFASIIKKEAINIENALADFIKELESYKTEETVYLHVIGIVLDNDFDIGNITLLKATEENLKNKLVGKLLKQKKGKKKDTFFEMFKKTMEKDFLGKPLSEFKVIAEPERAFERAKEETRRALEILRFASKSIYPMSEDIRIGLEDERRYSSRPAFILSDKQTTFKRDSEGSPKSFEINSEARRAMEKIGVFTLSDILQKRRATNFEEALLRAVHWFSSALLQSELENAFLCMIIALETIFTPKAGNPIANSIAEGVALILSKELESRKKIKNTVKNYYRKRSGVSHGGKKSILAADYFNLLYIVHKTIMELTKKADDFKSQESFLNWLEDLKLS